MVVGCEAQRPAGRSEQPARPAGNGGVVASAPATVDSAQQPQREQSVQTNPLCLQLDAPRTRVQLGEPVTLVVSLVNCSTEVQRVQDLLSPEFGFLQVWIQTPNGAEILNRPVANRDARGKPMRSVAPGERLSAFVPPYFGAEGWTMTRPGDYRIRAEYAVEATKVTSKPVGITVVSPENSIDRQAAEILMTREAGMFLVTGRDERGEGSRRMMAIAQDYGRSRLAAYARLALATAESRDRFDPQTKTFKKDGCERAADQLARAIPEVGDPVLAATGTATWIRCLKQLGRDGEATQALSVFFSSHPEAKTLPGVAQLLGAPARKD